MRIDDATLGAYLCSCKLGTITSDIAEDLYSARHEIKVLKAELANLKGLSASQEEALRMMEAGQL